MSASIVFRLSSPCSDYATAHQQIDNFNTHFVLRDLSIPEASDQQDRWERLATLDVDFGAGHWIPGCDLPEGTKSLIDQIDCLKNAIQGHDILDRGEAVGDSCVSILKTLKVLDEETDSSFGRCVIELSESLDTKDWPDTINGGGSKGAISIPGRPSSVSKSPSDLFVLFGECCASRIPIQARSIVWDQYIKSASIHMTTANS